MWVHGQQEVGHVLNILVKEVWDEKIKLWDQSLETRSEIKSKVREPGLGPEAKSKGGRVCNR